VTPEEAAEREVIARALDTLIALLQGFEQHGPLQQTVPLPLTAERIQAKTRRKGQAA
jgi:hypothetical protein